MSELNQSAEVDLLAHADLPRQVGLVFRHLSDEHIASKRRDDPEVTWRAIEQRLELKKPSASGALRGLPRALGWPRAHGRIAAWAAAAVVLFAVGGSGWFLFRGVQPEEAALTYSVNDAAGHGLSKGPFGTSQLLATEQESKWIHFSDSTVIELKPYTTLRVSLVEGGAVVARLVQGALKADVHHHDRTDYRFQAGDYEVKVVGTAFDLAFEPEPARFDLNLREGRVVVDERAGPTRIVRAGEQLHLPALADRQMGERQTGGRQIARGNVSQAEGVDLDSLAPGQLAPGQLAPGQLAPGQLAPGQLAPGQLAPDQETASPQPAAAPSYKDLARRGQFQAIVVAARRAGVDRVLAAKAPSELHELAQAARYTGQVALSEKVFAHLATEHARSPEGRSAAFFRGRLAEDSGRMQLAEQHYRAYRAQGGGAYSAEALGREMTLVQKTDGPAAARPLAAEYLRRFPRGAYRDLARTLALGSAAPR